MKVFIVITIILSMCSLGFSETLATIQSDVPSDAPLKSKTKSYEDSFERGYEVARAKHSSGGWFLGGVGSGFLLGLLGTTIITIAADGESPNKVPKKYDEEGYTLGYYKKSKSKNKWSAFGGGLLGTALVVVLLSSME